MSEQIDERIGDLWTPSRQHQRHTSLYAKSPGEMLSRRLVWWYVLLREAGGEEECMLVEAWEINFMISLWAWGPADPP